MTAPDQILAWSYSDPWGNELRWWAAPGDFTPDGSETAYVRRDPAVITQDETVLAMVGAAYVSAEIAVGSVDPQNEDDATAQQIAEIEAIRLLTPADAAAALAARDKRIRDEALEKAARFCRLRIMQNSPATDQDQAVAIDEAEVIEAAILRMKGAKP